MKYLLFFSFLIISTIANAQIQYKFNHLTTDDGLPSNSIYSIAEDKKGNIVLGTDNGLTVFDGNDFTNYNIKEGLINPYITAVSTDKNGIIWLINYNGKLQKFENNKIVNTPIFTETYNQLFNLKDKLFLYTIQNRFSNKCYGYNEINKNKKAIWGTKINTPPMPAMSPSVSKSVSLVGGRLVFRYSFRFAMPPSIKSIG